MSAALSTADAGEIIRRGRRLLRRGLLTHRELVLLDTLLWSCRRPNSADAIVSYTAIQNLAHISRGVIAKGLRRLVQLGLVQVIKRRMRVAWSGGVASRQATSCYRFATIGTEFVTGPVTKEMKIFKNEKPPVGSDLWAIWNRDRQLAVLGFG